MHKTTYVCIINCKVINSNVFHYLYYYQIKSYFIISIIMEGVICEDKNVLLENYKNKANSAVGVSILAMIFIDTNYKGLKLTVNITDVDIFDMYCACLPGIWVKYSTHKSLIRSYKKNGVYTNLNGAFDKGECAYQTIKSPTEFGDIKNIIEIEHCNRENEENFFKATLLRWNEPNKVLQIDYYTPDYYKIFLETKTEDLSRIK